MISVPFPARPITFNWVWERNKRAPNCGAYAAIGHHAKDLIDTRKYYSPEYIWSQQNYFQRHTHIHIMEILRT